MAQDPSNTVQPRDSSDHRHAAENIAKSVQSNPAGYDYASANAELFQKPRPSFDDHDSAYGSYSTPIQPSDDFKTQKGLEYDHDERQSPPSDSPPPPPLEEDKPPSWRSLPRKDQLAVLTLARLAEPLAQTSLASYMFFMLKYFDESLPDSTISSQAGFLTGSFTAAQCVTAVFWGRLADKEWMGRKNVLIIGLLGTCLSSLGFGFSTSFRTAMFFRTLGGALNGNVGVMRTVSLFLSHECDILGSIQHLSCDAFFVLIPFH